MGRQWAIAIGINNYSAFQSLSYAQNDAEAICRELLSSGRVTPANCLLLTTASALHLGQSTFPLQTTVLQWFQWLVDEALQADDELWVFFSGYGIHAEGKDYLMPVDGDPKQAAETGIELRSLYQLLQESACDRILMLLDMNHNEGTLATPVGIQTAQLAQEYGIATVQSCEPQKGQFSRKAAGMRHGFFTSALLDALQGNHLTTLAALNDRLKHRMEEFSDHYWRPEQTPLTVGDYTFEAAPVTVPSRTDAQGEGVAVGIAAGVGAAGLPSGATDEDTVTPLDVNYVPPSTNQGYGQDFAESWNWEDSGVPIPSGTLGSNGTPAPNPSTPNPPNKTLEEDFIEESSEDPYAIAWQEEQENRPGPGIVSPISGSSGSSASAPSASESTGSMVTNINHDYEEGKAGASSWHWADLVVAPEQPGAQGTGQYPEPPPIGQTETITDSPLTNPTITTMPPNWSWEDGNGDTNGLPPTTTGSQNSDLQQSVIQNSELQNSELQNSELQNSSLQGEFMPDGGIIQTIDVEPSETPLMMPPAYDDDDGGLPIIELDPLDPEEDEVVIPTASPGARRQLPWWLNLRLLGAAGLVLLTALGLLGLFNRTQEGQQNPDSERSGNVSPEANPSNPPASEESSQGQNTGQGSDISGANASSGNASTTSPTLAASPNVANPNASSPEASGPEVSSDNAADGNGASGDAASANASGDSASGDSASGDSAPLDDASDTLAAGESDSPAQSFSTAQAAAIATPETVAPEASSPAAPSSSEQGSSDGEKLLAEASDVIRPGQASSYNQAMTIARRVPSDDPNYKQARAQMDIWSQSMMRLAQERSGNGDYLGAIAAARLVPADLQSYPEAQESIAQWQAPSQLQHAKALLRPNSASSYNQAIAIARGIPDGITVSEEADMLRQEWSQEILNIAEQRAQTGQLSLAIAAAQLVPPDMVSYPEAQRVIAQWQERLN